MSDLALRAGSNILTAIGRNTAASTLVSVTGGSAHAMGSWVELHNGLPYRCEEFDLFFRYSGGGERRAAINIGIGASGSEVIVVPTILLPNATATNEYCRVRVPVVLPDGVRVAVQVQNNGASQVNLVGLTGITGGPRSLRGFSRASAVGFVSGSTRGTLVNAGGTANTKGGWTSIGALPFRARGLLIEVGRGDTAPTANADLHLDIGIRVSGGTLGTDTVVLYPNLQFRVINGGNGPGFPFAPVVDVNLPAGTEIDANLACSSTDAGSREPSVVVHAFG